ncbi:MAG: hypothetical protein ACREUL_18580 [Steroidobacteraceae bacterium]
MTRTKGPPVAVCLPGSLTWEPGALAFDMPLPPKMLAALFAADPELLKAHCRAVQRSRPPPGARLH